MIKITGLKEAKAKLKSISDAAEELNGKHEVAATDLLTDSFIEKNTKFKTAQELFDDCGFTINSPEDFAAIPNNEWDQYIISISEFDNWQDMLHSAAGEYARKKLGL